MTHLAGRRLLWGKRRLLGGRRAGLFSLPQGEVIFPIPPLSLSSRNGVGESMFLGTAVVRTVDPTHACSSLPPFLRVDMDGTHWGNGARVGEKKCQKAEGD